jgi:hypothetical protein
MHLRVSRAYCFGFYAKESNSYLKFFNVKNQSETTAHFNPDRRGEHMVPTTNTTRVKWVILCYGTCTGPGGGVLNKIGEKR